MSVFVKTTMQNSKYAENALFPTNLAHRDRRPPFCKSVFLLFYTSSWPRRYCQKTQLPDTVKDFQIENPRHSHFRHMKYHVTRMAEETWIDFLKAWPRIKYAKGKEPMAKIFERAVRLEPPKIAVEMHPDHGKLKILVALCKELQRAAGDSPFYLSIRTAGRLLNVTPVTANRWLFLLTSDGILKLVSRGGTADTVRQASRYRYVAK